jgi:hypothetical protein
LAEHTPDELLNRGEGWRNLLAVIRQELADETDFRRVYLAAIRRMEALHASNRPRWQELLEALLTWSYANRPTAEHAALQADAVSALSDKTTKEEIQVMSEKSVEYLYDRGILRGRAEGELLDARKILQQVLVQKFGPLPEEVVQRIQAATDVEQLHHCVLQGMQMKSLDELSL